MDKPYTIDGLPKISKKANRRMEFSRKHRPVRCVACKSGGTLRKLDGKYLCKGCYDVAIAGRLKYNL